MNTAPIRWRRILGNFKPVHVAASPSRTRPRGHPRKRPRGNETTPRKRPRGNQPSEALGFLIWNPNAAVVCDQECPSTSPHAPESRSLSILPCAYVSSTGASPPSPSDSNARKFIASLSLPPLHLQCSGTLFRSNSGTQPPCIEFLLRLENSMCFREQAGRHHHLGFNYCPALGGQRIGQVIQIPRMEIRLSSSSAGHFPSDALAMAASIRALVFAS